MQFKYTCKEKLRLLLLLNKRLLKTTLSNAEMRLIIPTVSMLLVNLRPSIIQLRLTLMMLKNFSDVLAMLLLVVMSLRHAQVFMQLMPKKLNKLLQMLMKH